MSDVSRVLAWCEHCDQDTPVTTCPDCGQATLCANCERCDSSECLSDLYGDREDDDYWEFRGRW